MRQYDYNSPQWKLKFAQPDWPVLCVLTALGGRCILDKAALPQQLEDTVYSFGHVAGVDGRPTPYAFRRGHCADAAFTKPSTVVESDIARRSLGHSAATEKRGLTDLYIGPADLTVLNDIATNTDRKERRMTRIANNQEDIENVTPRAGKPNILDTGEAEQWFNKNRTVFSFFDIHQHRPRDSRSRRSQHPAKERRATQGPHGETQPGPWRRYYTSVKSSGKSTSSQASQITGQKKICDGCHCTHSQRQCLSFYVGGHVRRPPPHATRTRSTSQYRSSPAHSGRIHFYKQGLSEPLDELSAIVGGESQTHSNAALVSLSNDEYNNMVDDVSGLTHEGADTHGAFNSITFYSAWNEINSSKFSSQWLPFQSSGDFQNTIGKFSTRGGSRSDPTPFIHHCKKSPGCLMQSHIILSVIPRERDCSPDHVALIEEATEDTLYCKKPDCRYSTTSGKYALAQHVRKDHDYKLQACRFDCEDDKLFNTMDELIRHIGKEHNDRFHARCRFPGCIDEKNYSRSGYDNHLCDKHQLKGDDRLPHYPPIRTPVYPNSHYPHSNCVDKDKDFTWAAVKNHLQSKHKMIATEAQSMRATHGL